jgi:hypothetical protein
MSFHCTLQLAGSGLCSVKYSPHQMKLKGHGRRHNRRKSHD